MKQLISLFLVLLLSSTTFFAQSAAPPPPAIETVQQSHPSAALTNQDIVSLVKAKLATEIIIAKIQVSPCDFDTSPVELQHLKVESVPAEIIVAMIGAPKAEQSPASSSIEANKPVTVKVPDGTLVEVEAVYSVYSSDIEAGNAISFRVVTPVKIGGVTVIEAGAPATGKVLKAKRGGRWGRAGELAWTLHDVAAVDETRIPLKFERSQKGDSKSRDGYYGSDRHQHFAAPHRPDRITLGIQARRRRVHFGRPPLQHSRQRRRSRYTRSENKQVVVLRLPERISD